MIKCRVCGELIGPTALSYKATSGFLDKDGTFNEDCSVMIHQGCHHEYMYSPFEDIEKIMKESI